MASAWRQSVGGSSLADISAGDVPARLPSEWQRGWVTRVCNASSRTCIRSTRRRYASPSVSGSPRPRSWSMAGATGRGGADSQLAAPLALECYAPGVGELAERVVMGHHEEFQLVQVTHQTLRGRGRPPGVPRMPRPGKPRAFTEVYLISLPPYLVEERGTRR